MNEITGMMGHARKLYVQIGLNILIVCILFKS